MTGGYMTGGQPLRQSLLRTYDSCPLMAQFDAEGYSDWSTGPQALGTAMHSVAEEIVRTLVAQDEEEISTEDAITIMREVVARPDAPHLSTRQLDDLRGMTLRFSEFKWTPKYVRSLEERLFVDIACPDGVTRTLTGQPDILIAEPPDGAIIVDLKSGQGKPAAPRNPDDPAAWTRDKGRPFLSERGHYQLDVYGLLVLQTYPRVSRVTLRELHVRWGETREAVLTRDDLEHVIPRVALQLMHLDQMLKGERPAEPRPGVHCHYCPARTQCPVPWEERGDGGVVDDEHAVEMAQRYVIASEIKDHHTKSLKAHLDAESKKAIPIPGGIVGWDREGTGRKFGVHKAAEA